MRQRPVRDVFARGAEGARGGGDAHGGHRRIRADRIDRPGVFRQGLLPRSGQRRCEALRAARRSAAQVESLRARSLGGARQAVHRDDPTGRRRPGHAAAALRRREEIEIPKTEVKDAELKLAQQLIEQQASNKFDPSAYKDEVRDRIEAAVQKKVEGQEITMAEEPEGGAQVIDLMEALRASLDKKAGAASKSAQPAQETEARKPPKRAAEAPQPAPKKAARK